MSLHISSPKCAFVPQGRFGNNLLQYIACKLFCKTFGYDYVPTTNQLNTPVLTLFENEADIQWRIMETPLKRVYRVPLNIEKQLLDECKGKDVLLHGYYQNLEFINDNLDSIRTLLNPTNTDFFNTTTRVCDLFTYSQPCSMSPTIVLHVRLDDFYNAGNGSNVLPLTYYEICIDNLILWFENKQKDIYSLPLWIVTDTIRTEKERNYLQQLNTMLYRKGFKDHNVQLHQKTFLEDWSICRDATYFISSNSTFAWTAMIVGKPILAMIPNTHYYPHQIITPLNHIETCIVWDL